MFRKRLFDLVVASTGLIILFPLLVLIALFVRLTSRGPILFRQERLGKDNARFVMYKFRTMKQDSGRDGEWRLDECDTRITFAGKLLRPYRVDELPQLVNVIKGEMSMVGPRPLTPAVAERWGRHVPNYDLRKLMKPGITGFTQIHLLRTSPEESPETLRTLMWLDLKHIRSRGIFADIVVLLKTAYALATHARRTTASASRKSA